MHPTLFPERGTVRCACGALNCKVAAGRRDGVLYFTSEEYAEQIEHDKAMRRHLGVLLARARQFLYGKGR